MAEESSADVAKLVEERFPLAERKDHFGVLGLPAEASTPQVQKAYFDLAKMLHPDKFGRHELEELRPQAAKVFSFATEAYELLSDATRRRKYMDQRGSDTPESSSSAPGRRVAEVTKIAYHKGSVMLTKRAYADAERFLRKAVESSPDVARYWRDLGRAIFHNTEQRKDEERLEAARECWERGLELDHADATLHYYMALFWKARGSKGKCRDALQAALYHKPTLVEAKRELRLMEMRRSNKRKGVLSSLFERATRRDR